MRTLDLAVLAFRLLGVWFAVSGITGLGNLPYVWESGSDYGTRRVGVGFVALPSLLTLAAGALLWLQARALAARVFADAADPVAGVPGDATATSLDGGLRAQPLFALCLSVIGVLMVTEATPPLAYGLSMFVQSRRTGGVLGHDAYQQALLWNAAAKANVTAALVRFLIGVGLLAGPARLSAAYARVRTELRSTLDDRPGDGV